jgi:cell wall-associated NlpC family hydrolase
MVGHPAHVTEFTQHWGTNNSNNNNKTATKTTTKQEKQQQRQQQNNKNKNNKNSNNKNSNKNNNKTNQQNNNKNINKTTTKTTTIPPAPFPHSVKISASLQPMITPKRAGVVKCSPSNLIFKRLRRGCDTVYVEQVT